MRKWSRRMGAATVALAMVGATACDDPFEVIEQVEFAPSLGIDLSQMTRLASGLYLEDLVVGEGDLAQAGNTAEVAYTAWLRTAEVFDAGQFSFTLGAGQVVAGFDEGVRGMRVGGERRIIIPPELGYGAAGSRSGVVPPGAIMIFRIELVSLQ